MLQSVANLRYSRLQVCGYARAAFTDTDQSVTQIFNQIFNLLLYRRFLIGRRKSLSAFENTHHKAVLAPQVATGKSALRTKEEASPPTWERSDGRASAVSPREGGLALAALGCASAGGKCHAKHRPSRPRAHWVCTRRKWTQPAKILSGILS